MNEETVINGRLKYDPIFRPSVTYAVISDSKGTLTDLVAFDRFPRVRNLLASSKQGSELIAVGSYDAKGKLIVERLTMADGGDAEDLLPISESVVSVSERQSASAEGSSAPPVSESMDDTPFIDFVACIDKVRTDTKVRCINATLKVPFQGWDAGSLVKLFWYDYEPADRELLLYFVAGITVEGTVVARHGYRTYDGTPAFHLESMSLVV